ncbi:hypothetical protein G3485_03430 [Shewanella baltica]|uniref:hypothetical protein n=1 Tax=Shewanella TaxID=22 RepID=UPI00005FDB2A|nr:MULTISPECIES: hypothetical protein [Shewanella]ABM25732.1 hypothetical protein Sputw3181_2915 [Shewanella sp. W3-18-1]MCS6125744.1 hypothetical protein [Shewanella baltica]MCS6138142.1 hypothetical protein [Shewanella baltica]MCS6144011.1 hypothetical protein [Shewanella baltica]MCS6168534.1 hypothetical protein [Shewanella baltica]
MPTELTVATISAGAVILAALISFIVAVSSAVIAKEQKVSEFRQAWINDFRADAATFISCSCSCIFSLDGLQSSKKIKYDTAIYLDFYNSSYSSLEVTAIRLQFRLNPTKDILLINSINKLKILFDDIVTNSSKEQFPQAIAEVKKHNLHLQKEVHHILKSEWERVKKGELRYKFFISTGKIFIGASLTTLFVLLLISNFPYLCSL